MANTKFTRAVKKAKGLYKTGRYKTFADAVKAAYKKIGSTHKDTGSHNVRIRVISGTKKKRPVRHKAKDAKGIHKHWGTVPAHQRRVSGIEKASVGTLKSEIKKRLNDSIDNLVLRKYHARLKRDKKKIQKTITEKKAELKKIC